MFCCVPLDNWEGSIIIVCQNLMKDITVCGMWFVLLGFVQDEGHVDCDKIIVVSM